VAARTQLINAVRGTVKSLGGSHHPKLRDAVLDHCGKSLHVPGAVASGTEGIAFPPTLIDCRSAEYLAKGPPE
jgi:hypothetical protein